MTVKPLSDRVLVLPNPAETTTASGLIIPDAAKEKPAAGKVVAVQPLSPATHRRLGGPLPHQLPNGTRAHLCTINLWYEKHAILICYEVLASVSRRYPSCRGRLLTRYSPVRH